MPMATVLAIGLLIGHRRLRDHPFLLGFESFGALALAVYVVLASFFSEKTIGPYLGLFIDPHRSAGSAACPPHSACGVVAWPRQGIRCELHQLATAGCRLPDDRQDAALAPGRPDGGNGAVGISEEFDQIVDHSDRAIRWLPRLEASRPASRVECNYPRRLPVGSG
jgi:hypothetical protein